MTMTAADQKRWRTHREHCPSRGTDNPCWGPGGCQRCVEIGNVRPTKASA